MPVNKRVLRRSPELRKIQNWLVACTNVGDVWRQEAVSMIPALLLGARPEHLVSNFLSANHAWPLAVFCSFLLVSSGV